MIYCWSCQAPSRMGTLMWPCRRKKSVAWLSLCPPVRSGPYAAPALVTKPRRRPPASCSPLVISPVPPRLPSAQVPGKAKATCRTGSCSNWSCFTVITAITWPLCKLQGRFPPFPQHHPINITKCFIVLCPKDRGKYKPALGWSNWIFFMYGFVSNWLFDV